MTGAVRVPILCAMVAVTAACGGSSSSSSTRPSATLTASATPAATTPGTGQHFPCTPTTTPLSGAPSAVSQAWTAYPVNDVPACNALDAAPHLAAVNHTGGKLSDADAQKLADAKLRFEAWYDWAAANGEPGGFIDGTLTPPNTNILSPDEIQLFPPQGMGKEAMSGAVVGCSFASKAVVVPSPVTAGKYGVVSGYVGPCQLSLHFSDGSTKPGWTLPAGKMDGTYDEGDIVNDPVLGTFLRVTDQRSCAGAAGAVGQACAEVG